MVSPFSLRILLLQEMLPMLSHTISVPAPDVYKRQEWNTRGKVMEWKIKQFFHKDNQTVVEWYFKNEMNNGNIEEFDGMSLIVWTADNKIK